MKTLYTPLTIYLLNIIESINVINIIFFILSLLILILSFIGRILLLDNEEYMRVDEIIEKWHKVIIIIFIISLFGCIFLPSKETFHQMIATKYYIENDFY